ncbi:MAG: pyridoxamine 5'-phosphate oxidase family protein [bacterium]|nr:pyridoxamine 5'-phosphate oxidase family protein [bacterium]
MTEEKLGQVVIRARKFLIARRAVFLATVNDIRIPMASHAPFVRDDEGDLFVYTSALSQHTKNMNDTHRASAIAADDESSSEDNLFARVRITFSCTAEVVERSNPEWLRKMRLFSAAFGEPFEEIRQLGDFTLFRLRPIEVVYVEGFGQAYRLDKKLTKSIHVRGTQPGAEAHR